MIKLANEEDAAMFSVGMALSFDPHVRWYTRLWRWVTRYRPPTPVVVTAIDEESGTITIGS